MGKEVLIIHRGFIDSLASAEKRYKELIEVQMDINDSDIVYQNQYRTELSNGTSIRKIMFTDELLTLKGFRADYIHVEETVLSLYNAKEFMNNVLKPLLKEDNAFSKDERLIVF